MKFLQNLSIAAKILIPPAVLVLALVAVSLSALYGLNFQRETLSEINDIALDKITLVDEFIALSEQVQSDVFRISVLRFMDLPEDEIQPIQERMERGLNDLNVIYGQILFEWSLDEEEQAIVERMKEPLDAFRQQARQAVIVASDNPSFGVILVRAATVPFAEFRSALTEFLDLQQAKIVRAEAKAAQRSMTVSTVILALALGITLVGMVATVLVSNRLIAQPIRSMTDLMGRLADGDLSIEVGELERRDEIGGMAQAVEVFRQNALEKAQAEEALRQSEEKLRNIVEHSTNLFYAHTSDHVLTYLSPQVKEMLGYEPAEAMVLWTDLATDHPINLRGLEITQKAINTGKAQPPYELELKHKQGHAVWVEIQEAPVVVDGKTVAIVGAATDITERKRAEEALRESQRQLVTLMSNLPGMAYRCSNQPGWPMDFVSEGCLALTGYTPAELTNTDSLLYDDLIHPEDQQMVWHTVQKAVRAAEPFVIEYRLRDREGVERWVWERGRAVGEDSGGTAILEGFISDITERKQAEEALRREKEFTDTALDSQMDTFFLFDPISGKALRWNKTFRDITGYTDEEIASMPAPASYYGPEDLARALPFIERVLKEGSGSIELDLMCKDGRKVPTEYLVSTIHDEEGNPKYFISIGRDITDRKQAEESLKKYSEQLEQMVEERTKELRDAQEELVRKEKLAVLGQLSGGVAHELRNPLGAIKNSAYLLNMILEKSEPEVKEALEIVEKEVGTCDRIIRTLLDFARTKAPARREVDVNDVLQAALSRITRLENVEVVSQLDEALPTILADPNQLAQVFGNILLNAVQAMPGGGWLVVKTFKTLEVSERLPKSEWVAISVADTGAGIHEENREKLFEPLFTTKARGIGLGLALVKTLVEGHGGTVEAHSEMGKGSTFTVKLPIGGNEES